MKFHLGFGIASITLVLGALAAFSGNRMAMADSNDFPSNASVGTSSVGSSNSQSKPQSSQQQAGKASESDQSSAMSLPDMKKAVALNQLHHINQKEIEMAKMAQDKAQSQQVKDAAKKIMTDHQNSDRQIQEFAQANGIKLQDFQPADYEKITMDQMSKLSGSQFDEAFLDVMRTGHSQTMRDLEAIRKDSKDPKVKSLITQTLPTIHQHEKMTSKMEASLSKSGSASSSSSTG